jgi:hypothetical protein
MKAQIRLAMAQAEMKARPRSRRPAEKTLSGPAEMKRRIAALVLVHKRGWSAAEIARQLRWRREDVELWFETGRPLL